MYWSAGMVVDKRRDGARWHLREHEVTHEQKHLEPHVEAEGGGFPARGEAPDGSLREYTVLGRATRWRGRGHVRGRTPGWRVGGWERLGRGWMHMPW